MEDKGIMELMQLGRKILGNVLSWGTAKALLSGVQKAPPLH